MFPLFWDLLRIASRQNAVKEFYNDSINRDELREYMDAIYDLERLLSKVTYNSINPRDMIALKSSVKMLPDIKAVLSDFDAELLNNINNSIDDLKDIYNLIDNAIIDDPPLSSKEGGFIKDAFNKDIDMLREAKTKGKQWLYDLENEEKEKTDIKNLRIKYNGDSCLFATI